MSTQSRYKQTPNKFLFETIFPSLIVVTYLITYLILCVLKVSLYHIDINVYHNNSTIVIILKYFNIFSSFYYLYFNGLYVSSGRLIEAYWCLLVFFLYCTHVGVHYLPVCILIELHNLYLIKDHNSRTIKIR